MNHEIKNGTFPTHAVEDMTAFFKVLGDDTRMRIVLLISEEARCTGDIAAASGHIRNAGVDFASGEELLSGLCSAADVLSRDLQALESAMDKAPDDSDALAEATYMRDIIIPAMSNLRTTADRLEQLIDRSYWPFPTYDQLLFSV